jgi:hypothetical protein
VVKFVFKEYSLKRGQKPPMTISQKLEAMLSNGFINTNENPVYFIVIELYRKSWFNQSYF